jgi:Fur family transcriptional regulator, ferric uptake regulator
MEQIKEHLLDNKNFKLTQERLLLLKIIKEYNTHFDADELHEYTIRKGEKLSRATIYRTLALFNKNGIIKQTIRKKGRAVYELVLGQEHHDHLICIKCGKIIEFIDTNIEELQKKVCIKYGFKPKEHTLSIRGYCKDCLETL